jgi:hypothetical protein
MKNFLFLLILFFLPPSLYSQDAKQEQEEQNTKMEQFASKTGVIIKFIDYNMPNLKVSYGIAETRVRKIIRGQESKFFLQISKEGKYDTKTASIAYEDLLEVIKALESLQQETASDISLNPDYLENKFITDDGFRVGYFVNKNEVTWYLQLEKYGSENTIFVNDVLKIESLFNDAKQKIETLKT